MRPPVFASDLSKRIRILLAAMKYRCNVASGSPKPKNRRRVCLRTVYSFIVILSARKQPVFESYSATVWQRLAAFIVPPRI
ncbi:MAG: hypothetical protein DMF38_11820 [Verrucomicrobia bacterium]|nr:MAG: hypothetical protein DMF38_11820 [Verrucomicrobiota bacterium]